MRLFRHINIIICVLALAAFTASCAVSTGEALPLGDESSGLTEDGLGDNPFLNPGDEDDVADIDSGADDDDIVVIEEDDDTIDDDDTEEDNDSVPVELDTEVDDVEKELKIGESYVQLFKVVDTGADYEWEVDGLSADSGLEIEKYNSRGTKAELKGVPAPGTAGVHEITVTVRDADDPSNSDSLTFDIRVESDVTPMNINIPENPCDYPLWIKVVKLTGLTNYDELQAAEQSYDIKGKVEIRLEAMRGDLPAKGVVEWSWESEVEDSEHCRFTKDPTKPFDTGPLPGQYEYDWVMNGRCRTDIGSVPATDRPGREVRSTTNPTWNARKLVGVRAQGDSYNKLMLKGRMLYDGPLPVGRMYRNEDPIEVLRVRAEDECEEPDVSGSERTVAYMPVAVKTLKMNVRYPGVSSNDGGAMTDIEVGLDYDGVSHYWNGGDGAGFSCEDGYEDVCHSHSHFAVVFTDGKGLKDSSIDALEDNWDMVPALKESAGFVHYNFKKCDGNKNNCAEKMVKAGDTVSDISEIKRVYLLWVVPPKMNGNDTYYADFNIKKIKFKNRYWSAKFRDRDDDFNNNITKDYTRLDKLWRFDGMSSPGKSSGGANFVFRRRELAGYVPDLGQ